MAYLLFITQINILLQTKRIAMKRTMTVFFFSYLFLLTLFFVCNRSSHAASINFDFNTIVTGQTPQSTKPWLTATFNDVNGGVQLTLRSSLETQSEFFSKILFNFNPELNPTTLNFQYLSGYKAFDIATGVNSQDIGAVTGYFDILFAGPTSNNPTSDRFNNFDISVYKITRSTSSAQYLTVSDFDFPSVIITKNRNSSTSSPTDYFAAAHLQGIPGEGSVKIVPGDSEVPIPEPGTIALLGIGLAGLSIYRWKSRRS